MVVHPTAQNVPPHWVEGYRSFHVGSTFPRLPEPCQRYAAPVKRAGDLWIAAQRGIVIGESGVKRTSLQVHYAAAVEDVGIIRAFTKRRVAIR